MVASVLLLLLNLLTVKLFGELEFWFAIIKVITIVALIIIGLIMLVTGFQTSSGAVSVENLWAHGGMFPNGIYGFLMAFQMVVFAFVGVELVGVSANETADPQKIFLLPLIKFHFAFYFSMLEVFFVY